MVKIAWICFKDFLSISHGNYSGFFLLCHTSITKVTYFGRSYCYDKSFRGSKSNPNVQLIELLHLALALALSVNLELNKTQHPTDREPLVVDALAAAHSIQRELKSSTLEEERTLLGCFYLTSAYVSHHICRCLRFSL